MYESTVVIRDQSIMTCIQRTTYGYTIQFLDELSDIPDVIYLVLSQ